MRSAGRAGFLTALLLAAGPAEGEDCRLPASLEAQRQRVAEAMKAYPGHAFRLGVLYADGRCIAEARAAFKQAKVEPGIQGTVARAIDAFDLYLDGLEAQMRGDLRPALQKFEKAFAYSKQRDIVIRSLLWIAAVSHSLNDNEAWKRIEQDVETLAGPPNGYWQALYELRQRQVKNGRSAEAVQATISDLARPLPPQERMELQVLLLQLLALSQRWLEAELLLDKIGRGVRAGLLDPAQRAIFFDAAAGVEGRRGGQIGGGQSAQRAGEYAWAAQVARGTQ